MQHSYQTGLREGSLPGAVSRCYNPRVQGRAKAGVQRGLREEVRDRGEGRVPNCSKDRVLGDF